MLSLASALSKLHPVKALVVGDLLLDVYTIGKAKRISPEAPIAIVNVVSEDQRPGGAGNVIINLSTLGVQVSAMGRIGNDVSGYALKKVLEDESVDISFLFTQEGYKTPLKNRIISDNQQIVRIDHEQINPIPKELEQQIIDRLPESLKGIDVLAISDYGKGFLTPALLSALISEANKQDILIIVDPKGQDFARYKGAHIIKPNLSEAYAAANLPMQASLDSVSQRVLEITCAQLVMITRAEAGISLFEASGVRSDFPVQAREIKDVTGAGDTVLAMLAYALANKLSYSEAAHLCNVAAGMAIEKLGCARITLADLAYRLLKMNPNNKVFDETHQYALQRVLASQPFQVITLTNHREITLDLFQEIKSVADNGKGSVLVYIDERSFPKAFVEMLASFKEIDFILLHSNSLKGIFEKVLPAASYVL